MAVNVHLPPRPVSPLGTLVPADLTADIHYLALPGALQRALLRLWTLCRDGVLTDALLDRTLAYFSGGKEPGPLRDKLVATGLLMDAWTGWDGEPLDGLAEDPPAWPRWRLVPPALRDAAADVREFMEAAR
jgi:hypothetical protein